MQRKMKYIRLFTCELVENPKSIEDFGGEPMGSGYLPAIVKNYDKRYLIGVFTAKGGNWNPVNYAVLVENHQLLEYQSLSCERTILNKESLQVMFIDKGGK